MIVQRTTSGPPEGVPRRFGIGAMLVFIVLCSVVSALVPTPGSWILLAAMVVIGLAQMRAGQGSSARWASVAVGAVGLPLTFVWLLLDAPGRIPVVGAVIGLVAWTLFGGCFGYLLGTVVAGAFLVAWWIDRAIGRAPRSGAEDEYGLPGPP